jgi:hypothetical protein
MVSLDCLNFELLCINRTRRKKKKTWDLISPYVFHLKLEMENGEFQLSILFFAV